MSHRALIDAFVHSKGQQTSGTSLSLLKRAASGEEEAWRRLRDLYSPLVFHWCNQQGLRDQDVADVGQDVFLAMSRNLRSFQHDEAPGSFLRWLRSIVRTKIIDWHRREKTRPVAKGGSDALVRLVSCQAEGLADDEEGENERSIIVRQAIETIAKEFPGWYKAAFLSLMLDDVPALEVAGHFGVRVSAVYTVKSRMLKRLRLELEGLLE